MGGALIMWARGISEFGAVVILAYHPKIVPVLIYERFEGFGLNAALPVAVVLIGVVPAVFALLRLALMPERPDEQTVAFNGFRRPASSSSRWPRP